jgi:hypothetical protein
VRRLPFGKPGTFRKGNIHTHSTASDGELEPEEVCRRYRDGGYDFVAITDHYLDEFDPQLAESVDAGHRPRRTGSQGLDECILVLSEQAWGVSLGIRDCFQESYLYG